MTKSASQIALENDLSEWKKLTEFKNRGYIGAIKWQVNEHLLSKIDAIKLICQYKLFPLSDWLDCPDFMEDGIAGEDYNRKEAIEFYNLVEDKTDFLPEDGSEPRMYAPFPKITNKEAINLTYDFMIEHKIRGCHFDW